MFAVRNACVCAQRLEFGAIYELRREEPPINCILCAFDQTMMQVSAIKLYVYSKIRNTSDGTVHIELWNIDVSHDPCIKKI